jgi:wobble nucleotide-excising tRNase
MIKKIDINKFALFNEYSWDKTIGKDTVFKTVNIIYGRNYSGKTTLSRIFRCVEKGEIHENYSHANFSMSTNSQNLTQNNLSVIPVDINIRVYNTDFVRENLSWLHNDDGSIKPFALIGSINIELDKKIKAIDEKLGKEEDKKGLHFELSEKSAAHKKKQSGLKTKEDILNNSLSNKAKLIKENTALFDVPAYTVTNIKKDIPKSTTKRVLSDEVVAEKKKLLKEEYKVDINNRLSESKPKFSDFYTKTNELLTQKIKPSQTITDLINDSLLQDWVWQGINKHKDKRDSCGFCGNPISTDLWEKLDAHFNEESKTLRINISTQIEALKKSKQGINDYQIPSKESFYVNFHDKHDVLYKQWQEIKTSYSNNIEQLITALKTREKDIFTAQTTIEIDDLSENIVILFKAFNQIIEQHNQKSSTLTKDQKEAKTDLRLSEVATFLQTINYSEKTEEIERFKKEMAVLDEDKNKSKITIGTLTEEKRVLEAQANDESKGAELVNEHLKKFFGHDGLILVSEGVLPVTKFKIMRDGVEANNLSEGECSLIAFCYFMAKIDDELNKNELIIYIDDPISSLDSNHVFFMFSLIDSVIAKPKKYAQLFISTHNLDFLRYLKRITSKKNDIEHFLIERQKKQNNKRSLLTKMPDHIKKYSTEFNYLFGEIYCACQPVKGDKNTRIENTYSTFYNVPNNLRKFLECYLFFKYPNNEAPLDNLDRFFDGNVPSLINRIVNEHSHLSHIDRALKPMDIDEIEECAKAVIQQLEIKDNDQFLALVASLD